MDYEILPLPPSPSEREWIVYCKKLEAEIERLRAALLTIRNCSNQEFIVGMADDALTAAKHTDG